MRARVHKNFSVYFMQKPQNQSCINCIKEHHPARMVLWFWLNVVTGFYHNICVLEGRFWLFSGKEIIKEDH